MDLSVLNLPSPRRRFTQSARFMSHSNLGYITSNPTSPSGSSPSSPSLSGASIDDGMFTEIEQQPVAIPFKWEETPGTPRRYGQSVKEVSGSQQEDSPSFSRSWSSSSFNSGDCSSEKISFDKPCESFLSTNGNTPTNHLESSTSHILPLKPPPRMSTKQLPVMDRNSLSSRSFSGLIINIPPSRSFRKDALKALPFLTTPRKEHTNEDFGNTMLGFEEWPKLKRNAAGCENQRGSPLSFSSRKLHEEKKDDVNSIANEDSGKTADLRARRPLSSMSSRSLADGSNFISQGCKSWEHDIYVDDSACGLDSKAKVYDSDFIAEQEPGKDMEQEKDPKTVSDPTESVKQNRKRHVFTRWTRLFGSTRSTPSRLSSGSPALPPTQGLQAKHMTKHQHPQNTSRYSFLNMYTVGYALIRNVKQLRSFDFHSRHAAAK